MKRWTVMKTYRNCKQRISYWNLRHTLFVLLAKSTIFLQLCATNYFVLPAPSSSRKHTIHNQVGNLSSQCNKWALSHELNAQIYKFGNDRTKNGRKKQKEYLRQSEQKKKWKKAFKHSQQPLSVSSSSDYHINKYDASQNMRGNRKKAI